MVTTYLVDLHPLEDPEIYEKYYNALPLWRKEKVDKIRLSKNKIQSIGAWTLFTSAATQASLDFKQAIDSPEDFLASSWVNISHSSFYALCAISNNPATKVGCDIETIGKFRESVARRCFCTSEYQHLMNTTDPTECTHLFYRYWVLKESFLKATRQGMKLDTRSFEIGWEETKKPYLLKQPVGYPEDYRYQEYFLPDRKTQAAMAICTTDTPIDPTLHILHL